MNFDLQSFLQTWTGGAEFSDAERQRLLQLLENDPAFRAECAEEVRLLGLIKAVQTPSPRWLDLHDALGLSVATPAETRADDLASRVLHLVQNEPRKPANVRWFAWRPLTAAAAGLSIGLFSASVVFGYVMPRSVEKVMSLLQESFESGLAPLVVGVPMGLGMWSGDFTEVVGAQQGVKPESGKKMLRFLRADFDGKVKPEGSYISDVYQLIDLRPYRREFADGGAVVQLSAAFNAFAFPAQEAFGCSVSLHALDAETAMNGSTRFGGTLLTDCLAMVCNSRMKVDRDPATWQRLNAELRLPPNADFILIRIGLEHSNKAQRRETFDGHYLDGVRLTLARRAPLP